MQQDTYISIAQQAKEKLKSINRIFITPFACFNLMINVLFGTGPIYLPGPFLGAGWALSSIFIVGIAVLSWICADFVIESMSNYHAIKALEISDDHDVTNTSSFTEKDVSKKAQTQGLLSADETEQTDVDQEETQDSSLTEQESQAIEQDKLNDTEMYQGDAQIFKLKGVAEFGEMAQMLFGKAGNIAVSLILAIYLMGVLISKSIVASSILSLLFHTDTEGDEKGSGTSIPVLDNYFFWLSLFSVLSIFLSFKDIASIKSVQLFIVIFRFVVIALLIFGPIGYMISNGTQSLTPVFHGEKIGAFNFDQFEAFFSTAIFGLLCHHSIPSMMSNVSPVKSLKKVSIVSFLIGAVMFIVIPIFGILAFGADMLEEDNKEQFSNNFKGKIDWIYYITSFYMFLNIAAFPVIVITTRNNLLKCFKPDKVPKKSYKLTKWTIIMTIITVAPIVLLSIVAKDQIESVIKVVGGVFGVFLMMLIPATLTIFTRKKLTEKGVDLSVNPHRCTISSDILPWIVNGLGVCCLVFNLYQDIAEWVE